MVLDVRRCRQVVQVMSVGMADFVAMVSHIMPSSAPVFKCGHPKSDTNSAPNGISSKGTHLFRCRQCFLEFKRNYSKEHGY